MINEYHVVFLLFFVFVVPLLFVVNCVFIRKRLDPALIAVTCYLFVCALFILFLVVVFNNS